MRENSDGAHDGGAPRPQTDRLCYQYNRIPLVPLNNSHPQQNLGLRATQDVAGGDLAVGFGKLSMTTHRGEAPRVP